MRRLILAILPLFTACSTLVRAPRTEIDGRNPQAAWARNLARHVDASGSIDFEGMGADSGDLDLFVTWVAQAGKSELQGDARLAYLINAYNALAMYNVLHSGLKPQAKVRFFYLRKLEEDGRALSLYSLENDVIRKLGDPRIHFALNCMVRSCPRLPQVPFEAETLDAQLDAAAREFLNDERHVVTSPEDKKVSFSSILKWYSEDFLTAAPDLITYANKYRNEPIPGDWTVEFLSYDWTLNQQEQPTPQP